MLLNKFDMFQMLNYIFQLNEFFSLLYNNRVPNILIINIIPRSSFLKIYKNILLF